MKLNIILFAGAAIGAISLAAPLASQGSKDGALDAACRSTEVTAPDSCPCTITAARKAGLNDTELASLFKDDGHSQPVDQGKYGRFWQVKSQCIADATMAKMGITPGNPLPGVPANMRPGAPFPPANTPVPPIARPGQSTPPAAVAAAAASPLAQPGRRTVADVEAMIAKLSDTAWEYTAPKSEGGEWHRIDFLADGNLMIFQTANSKADSKNAEDRSARMFRMSAEPGEYGASIRTDEVDSGMRADLPINSLSDTVLMYQKRYVRTGEEWPFRKVGKANPDIPSSGPQPLADGFWQVRFPMKIDKTNPFFERNYRLEKWTSASRDGEAYEAPLAGLGGLILIKYTGNSDCNHNCILVVNDVDPRTNQAQGRLIEHLKADSIGVRVEESAAVGSGRPAPYRISVRAYDGYGGFTEWLCTDTPKRACRQTGKQAPRPAATVSTAGLAERLGTVKGEVWGDAACSNDYYLAPADRSVLRSVGTLERYIRTNGGSLIATQVDVRGNAIGGIKLKIDGRERVLPSTGDQSWGAGGVRFVFRPTGEPIYDNPAYGFTPGTAALTIDGQTQSIDMIVNGAC